MIQLETPYNHISHYCNSNQVKLSSLTHLQQLMDQKLIKLKQIIFHQPGLDSAREDYKILKRDLRRIKRRRNKPVAMRCHYNVGKKHIDNQFLYVFSDQDSKPTIYANIANL
jgi:hypothetical protein